VGFSPIPIALTDCATVLPVNNALLFGLPVLVVVVLIALIYRTAGNQPDLYRLPQPWTHEPILWSATEEPLPAGHHGADHHAHDQGADHHVGGGASGRW
jgi:hypothetical protein